MFIDFSRNLAMRAGFLYWVTKMSQYFEDTFFQIRELSFFTSGGVVVESGGSHENISIKRGDHEKIFLI